MSSAGVRESRTEVAGVEIRSSGRGEGPPVVVLHHSFGNPGWLPFHEQLARTFALEAPDLPGFGGWVASELAVIWPEGISHLVLVGSAGILPERGRILDQVLVSHSEYVRAAFHRPEAYEAVYGADLPDDLLIQWDLNREMTARVAWKPHMYNRRLVPLLPLVRIPVLVVWGEEDQVVPLECGERFARLLPDARLEVVADCGHAVDMEQPEALARLVRDHLSRGEPCS